MFRATRIVRQTCGTFLALQSYNHRRVLAHAAVGTTMEQLILAIEPDRRQSARLGMLASNLRVELLIVTSVNEGLEVLDTRVPDLLLASPQIVHREQMRLTERLDQLAAEGLKITTLPIPLLEAQNRRAPEKGTVIRFHSARAHDAVDPMAFGMQLARQLDRIAAERPITERRPSSTRAGIETGASQSTARNTEPTEQEGSFVASPAPSSTPRPAGWRDLLSSLQRDVDRMRIEAPEPDASRPATVNTATRTASAAPAVTPGAPATRQPAAAASRSPSSSSPGAQHGSAKSAEDAAKKRKPKPQPPAQDEWGMFDPEQCGLAALRNRLNEISGNNPKKPV